MIRMVITKLAYKCQRSSVLMQRNHNHPGTQHSRPMLLNLQHLDIIIRHSLTSEEDDARSAHASLQLQRAPTDLSRNHQHSHRTQYGKEKDNVPIEGTGALCAGSRA